MGRNFLTLTGFFVLVLLFSSLCGCTSASKESASDVNGQSGHPVTDCSIPADDGQDDVLPSGDELRYYIDAMVYYEVLCAQHGHDTYDGSDALLADDPIAYYDDALQYYEILCDEYGYETYEHIAYPERWNCYVPNNGSTYHHDWLCPEFNNSDDYVVSADADYYEQFEGYQLCELCGGIDILYLDVEAGIYHNSKGHLDSEVNYRLVSEESAISAGYTLCNDCE